MAVFVVGSANADLILPVAKLPEPGATILSGDPVRAGGGKGANVAVAAARDGADVRLVVALGDDDLGAATRAELQAEGVGIDGVTTLDDRPTGLAMICVEPDGENFIVVAPGANAALDPTHVAHGLYDLGHNDVCVVNFEIPQEAIAAAVEHVRSAGGRMVMNPSPVRSIDGLVTEHTTLVVNAGELAHLTGEHDIAAGAERLKRQGARDVVVTRGADGVHVLTHDGEHHDFDAFPAEPQDTTGAGDTFTGVLAGAIAAGATLTDAAQRGAAAAALSTEQIGARSAMPRTAATDRLLAAGARRPG